MSINKGLTMSTTDLWSTPQWLFDELDSEFGFTVDVCALPDNAKCKDYFTPEINGLDQPWTGNVWCNPPYGRQIGEWVQKASQEVEQGQAKVVVMLLPARTDTKWFHALYEKGAEMRFLKGRLKFGNEKWNAPFPSVICVLRGLGERDRGVPNGGDESEV